MGANGGPLPHCGPCSASAAGAALGAGRPSLAVNSRSSNAHMGPRARAEDAAVEGKAALCEAPASEILVLAGRTTGAKMGLTAVRPPRECGVLGTTLGLGRCRACGIAASPELTWELRL
eukprot:scaffold4387_cov400-Prasinococcus_capsulatus_cf.AAC.7